jgi:hypothetical protein
MNTIEEHLDFAEEYVGWCPIAVWHIQEIRKKLKRETGKSQPIEALRWIFTQDPHYVVSVGDLSNKIARADGSNQIAVACLCGSEFYLVIQDRFSFKPVFSCPACGRELDWETGGKLWVSRRQP